jgi:predicted trehalose synthase
VSVAFSNGYLSVLAKSDLLRGNGADLHEMLQAYLLNQVMVELGQELNQPSGRLRIPLRGIQHLLGGAVVAKARHGEGGTPDSNGPKNAASPSEQAP